MSLRIISETDELVVYQFECSMCGTAPIASTVYALKTWQMDFACKGCVEAKENNCCDDYVPVKKIVFVPN